MVVYYYQGGNADGCAGPYPVKRDLTPDGIREWLSLMAKSTDGTNIIHEQIRSWTKNADEWEEEDDHMIRSEWTTGTWWRRYYSSSEEMFDKLLALDGHTM